MCVGGLFLLTPFYFKINIMKDIIYIALIIALLYILFTRDKPKPPDKETIVRIDTFYMPYKITITKRDTIRIDTTIYQDVPYLDSTAIKETLKKYFAKNVQTDTLRLKYGYISTLDTIQSNKLLSRTWNADLTIPEREITVKEPPKHQFFIGPRLEISKFVNQAGFDIIWKDKKDRLYDIGVGVDRYKSVNFGLGFYMKL